jgi:hypothetical protein
MSSGYGDAIGVGIIRIMFVVAIISFLLGALLVWGLPELWAIVKPLIHSITA